MLRAFTCIDSLVLPFESGSLTVYLLDLSQGGTLSGSSTSKCPKLGCHLPHCLTPPAERVSETHCSCVQMFSSERQCWPGSSSRQQCLSAVRDSFILSVAIKSHSFIDLIYPQSLKIFVFASVQRLIVRNLYLS